MTFNCSTGIGAKSVLFKKLRAIEAKLGSSMEKGVLGNSRSFNRVQNRMAPERWLIDTRASLDSAVVQPPSFFQRKPLKAPINPRLEKRLTKRL